MLVIVGIIVVFGSVLGGFILMQGPIPVLIQPAELIVIGGAVIGTIVVGSPGKLLGLLFKQVPKLLKGSPFNRQTFLEMLLLQYELFVNVKKGGWLAIEDDVTQPDTSEIFLNSPKLLANPFAKAFLCDALNMLVNGSTHGEELEMAMDAEIEARNEENAIVPGILSKASDSLPGLGIVAAVLGIVVTMQHIDGPPEEIGHHVAAALVGTFLGLLLSYGALAPMAANLEKIALDEARYFHCIKAGVIAFAQGGAPATAVEFARRTIFSVDRPPASEVEERIREIKPR